MAPRRVETRAVSVRRRRICDENVRLVELDDAGADP
jgi:hypothetical protein